MRAACVLLVALCSADTLQAAPPSLPDARLRWLHGNYAEAREIYESLQKQAATHDAATLGLSRCLQSRGEYEDATRSIETALTSSPRSAALRARLAELLYLRGRWSDAEHAADAAVALQDDCFLARWVRAQVYRDRGDTQKADTELRWFIRTYTNRSEQDHDIKDPDELLLVGLAGSDYARWHHLADQFQFILNDVYSDALKADKDFWPAEYEAGKLLLEKYNRGEALAAFEKALTINPHAAEALAGMGQAALQQLEYQTAEHFAERALRINPRLVDALNLRADVYLATGDLKGALKELDEARAVNPRNEATLGRVAACLFLQHKPEAVARLAGEVKGFDSKPGQFYFVLAEHIEEHHRFDDAERYYKQAIALRPQEPWARNNLGLFYMRMGREDEARATLTAAFEADAFNVRVSNTLKVLRHLEKYETVRTPHFTIRFDPKNDRLLARYMTRYLEEIYEELAGRFGYRPTGPILIEVFNNHTMFSGRTIALPDLYTIGASTGRMFAMVSPHGKGIARPFNWARVLRHELTHVFNLEQTSFQVPHWFTEGLAVTSEHFPRPQEWNELLLERVPAARLIKLDKLDQGFIRPHSLEERQFAYCESQLYIDYLSNKYGQETVGRMLAAYKAGLDTPAAVRRVCKVDPATLESEFAIYLTQKILPTIEKQKLEKPMSFSELRDAHESDPADIDIAARLAESYLRRGDAGQARKLADGVLAKFSKHPRAARVKALLLNAAGDDQAARHLLQSALDPKKPDAALAAPLGKLYFEAKDYAQAAKMYELARQAQPYERQWLVELARVYVFAADTPRRIETLKKLVPLDADDLTSRKELAQLLEKQRNHREAARYARQALEIDVADATAQRVLGDALLGQDDYGAAIEAYGAAVEIKPGDDEARLGLARAFAAAGRRTDAVAEVDRVLAHDPDNETARALREKLVK